MLSRWWAADARVERMGARPNRAVVVKTALTCVLTLTVVRFWNLVESESFPMQDEPERRTCFQHKMSLKD
jgi:hypothetical protein